MVLHSRRSLSIRFDIPTARTQGFWDALREGRFVTTKCKACGNVCFPPQADCPKCMAAEHSWVELPREATLITYTHVRVAPASFTNEGHYTVAVGELTGGLKVLAWLQSADSARVKPRMKMMVEIRESAEGNPYYVFVPA